MSAATGWAVPWILLALTTTLTGVLLVLTGFLLGATTVMLNRPLPSVRALARVRRREHGR